MGLPERIQSPIVNPLVVSLSDVRGADVAQVGAKAANLAELRAAGFATPDGIVVTTTAYELSVGELAAAEDPQLIESAELPPAVETAIVEALGELAEVPVAVRSSAVAEDLAGASFAGQYDTVLDARGPAAILAAIRRCWASSFSPRVKHYRAQRDIEASPMAVVIQRLVQADAAGVAFTANPVTGRRSECLVSAVRGLGERLVSGIASPDEFVVEGDRVEVTARPEEAIDEAAAQDVAALALRAQAHFGTPQDVEWAIEGGRLFLLQSRPITALPVEPIPLPIDPPEGYWEQDPSHNTQPLSPLFRQVLFGINRYTAETFAWAGFLMERMDWTQIGGTVYQRFVPLGGKDTAPPPAWLMPIIMPILRRVIPSMRRRIARCVEAYRNDEFFEQVVHWDRQGRADIRARHERLRRVDLAALDDAWLAAHFRACKENFDYAMQVHIRVVMSLSLIVGEFVLHAKTALDWEERKILELLAGSSVLSTAPARSITALARMAAQRPEVRAVLETGGPGCDTRLAKVDSEFAAAFDRHQYEFGCRGSRGDIMYPTIGEQPELLAQLIVGQMKLGITADDRAKQAAELRTRRLAQAREELAEPELAEFERLLERALVAYPQREDNACFTHGVAEAVLRYAALEAGRRLAARGDIGDRDDIFYLEHDELLENLTDAKDRRDLVARRKGEYAWACQAELPFSFGPSPPPDPPMDWMPEEMRRVMSALMWLFESSNATEQSNRKQDGEGGIVGLGAAPGTYEGTVRIVLSEDEFHKIQPGDVLVCQATQPVWAVLFSNLGAVIADAGGVTSHQAIVSREYGIPAVVATGNATELLTDGQRVRVDGTHGRIEVIG